MESRALVDQRWRFTRALMYLCLVACQRPAQVAPKAEVLCSLVQGVMVPNLRALVSAQETLTVQLEELERSPSDTTLQHTRTAWREALLVWERTELLRIGPMVDTRAQLRGMFWPIRTTNLTQLQREPVPDNAAVDQLGVDVRGMFALEWLFYGAQQVSLSADTRDAAHQRALASAFARNVAHYAQAALDGLGDGRALLKTLNADEQGSINHIAHLLVSAVETLATDRLAPARVGVGHRAPRLHDLRGAASDSAGALIAAQLLAAQTVYVGPPGGLGLSALVKAAAPAIDTHLRLLFAAALTRVAALESPLEQTLSRDPQVVESVYAAIKDLERAMKAELPSALGLTLTFEAGDGD